MSSFTSLIVEGDQCTNTSFFSLNKFIINDRNAKIFFYLVFIRNLPLRIAQAYVVYFPGTIQLCEKGKNHKMSFRVYQIFCKNEYKIDNKILTSSVTWFARICNSSSSVRGGPATSAGGGAAAAEGISVYQSKNSQNQLLNFKVKNIAVYLSHDKTKPKTAIVIYLCSLFLFILSFLRNRLWYFLYFLLLLFVCYIHPDSPLALVFACVIKQSWLYKAKWVYFVCVDPQITRIFVTATNVRKAQIPWKWRNK